MVRAPALQAGNTGSIPAIRSIGKLVEWSITPVLKTGDVKASVGSNPTLTANIIPSSNSRTTGLGPVNRGAIPLGIARELCMQFLMSPKSTIGYCQGEEQK